MRGKVDNGALVTLEPRADYYKNDVVLVRVKGRVYLHLIKAKRGERFLVGNNVGFDNGWVGLDSIYGKAVEIEK